MTWTDPRTWVTDELVTAAMMNQHIRDNFDSVMHLIARKSADQSVTSSTTLVDDTVLILPVGANEVWQVELMLLYTASTSGHLKVAFTFPTGGTVAFMGPGPDETGAWDQHEFWTTTSPTSGRSYGALTGGVQNQPISGIYVNGSTAGSLTLQFAQNASHGTATTMKANSTLWGMQLA